MSQPNLPESQWNINIVKLTIIARLLSQISRTLLQQQIEGLGDLTQEGTFSFGNLEVEVFQTAEGLVINIFDTSNGEQTQVIVPN